MPDFGLTEALSKALQASKAVEVMRPAEAKLAAAAGKAAPKAAPVVPEAAPSAAAPPATPPGGGVQAPAINPSVPPPDRAAPPVDPTAATPAPENVAASATTAAPDSAAPAAPEAPVAPAPVSADPAAISPVKRLPAEAPPPAAPARTPVQEEAARFVGANMGDFAGKLDMTHMPNTGVMSSPDGVKAAILQVADDNKAAIETARGPEVGEEQLTGLAQDLSIDKDTLRQTFDREFGADTPETRLQRNATVVAARMVEQNTAGKLMALSDRIINGTATSADIAEWTQNSEALVNWRTSLAGVSSDWGRTGHALSTPVGLPVQVMDHVAQILKQNNPDMAATAAAIKLAGTPGGIANIVGGMADMSMLRRAGKAAFGFVQRMYINGILWGPQTWAKIFIGNNLNVALNSLDLFAAGIGRATVGLAARLGEFPTAAEGVQLSDAYAHIHGVISGGADALRVAGRVARTGQSLDALGAGTRASEGADTRGTIYAQLPELQGTYFGAIAHGIDQVFSASGSRIINSIDEFSKTLGYRGYLQMMQLKELRARLTAGEVKPGEAESVMTDLMKNPSPEMQQAAEMWAHRMTFQTPFPEGGVGEAFQNVLNKAPALRFIFPFMRTATNIFKQSLIERTPLAVFSSRLRQQIANGGFEGDLAKSRIATGTAIGSMFAWMAIHDRITGSAPKDAKERAVWEMDGRTPYSIRTTDPVTGKDTWRDYSWMEPVATVAGTVTDAVKLQAYIHGYDQSNTMLSQDSMLHDAIAHIAASIITNTGNKTFMMGAAQFSEAYNDPNRAFSLWADQVAASTVPMSGLSKFGRNLQDPYLRQAHTLMDKIRDEMPSGMGVTGSQSLPPRLDVFGEPRTHQRANSVLGPLTPLPSSDVKKDPVVEEVQTLMEQTRTVPLAMPSEYYPIPGPGGGIQGGRSMRLTPAEYNDYVKKSRSDPVFDGGTLNLHEKLEQTIALPVYQQATAAERVELLGAQVRLADKIGRQRLLEDNTDFAERVAAQTAQKNRLLYNQ